MNPSFLLVPLLFLQAPAPPAPAPLPVLEAKNLPRAPRGPAPPQVPDLGTGSGLLSQARHVARKGPSVPALQLPEGSVRVKDKIPDISGRRAYAIEVSGGGSVKVRVVEGRKAWFRVLAMNAWGTEETGLLQNRIPTGEPEAAYKNPTRETRTIYFIVDTLDASMTGEEFTIEVVRG